MKSWNRNEGGTSWKSATHFTDASRSCHRALSRRHHAQCPGEEGIWPLSVWEFSRPGDLPQERRTAPRSVGFIVGSPCLINPCERRAGTPVSGSLAMASSWPVSGIAPFTVLQQARKLWKAFEKAPAGERFVRLHHAQKEVGGFAGTALFLIGIALVIGGVVLLFIPGPGILLIAFGAALVSQRSLWLAEQLDSTELLARRLARKIVVFWKAASTPMRAAVIALAGVVAAGAAYATYALLLKN